MKVSRRHFVASLGAAGAAGVVFPSIASAAKWRPSNRPRLTGRADHTYEFAHDWLVPPASIAWGDTHGLAQDKSGRIYVAHTVHPSSTSPDAVVVFDDKGKFIESWGGEFKGGAHGLDIRDEGGEEFLYHCDTSRCLVVKTNLKGNVVWQKDTPSGDQCAHYAQGGRFVPTNVAFAPDSAGKPGDIFVGDGYGASFIHRYTSDGEFVKTIATPGSGEGQVNCPHGLWVDDRSGEPLLAVADRGNRRIHYLTLDGSHVRFVTDGMRMPCHFKTREDLLLVPDLESVVTLLDRDNRVIVHLGHGHPSQLRGAPREQFIAQKFIHPHTAIFLHTGDILVAEWVPIGRITLLRRMEG
jgi:hypothetical protein